MNRNGKRARIFTYLTAFLMLVGMLIVLAACGGQVKNVNLTFKVDGETYATITTNGKEAISIPDNPEKAGYTFDCWYWDEGTWQKPFTANSLLDAPITGDMSVYARFEAISYDVTYVTDGGTTENPASYTVEDNITFSPAVKRGYRFVGWYTDVAHQNAVLGIPVGTRGEKTFYAAYEALTYTVTYENTCGAENPNPVQYTVESGTLTLSPLARKGYTFDGFYLGEEKVTAIPAGSVGDLTLTARWTANTYAITYIDEKNAPNPNPTSYTVENGKIPLLPLEKAGYTFDGFYLDGKKITEIASGTVGDLTITVRFVRVDYSLTYTGTKEAENRNPAGYTVESETFTLLPLEKEGYLFDGWYLDGQKVTEIAKGTTGNLTLTARFVPVVYPIRYHGIDGATHDNAGGYTVETGEIVLRAAKKRGYTFLAWYADEAHTRPVTSIPAGNIGAVDLYAAFEIVTYTATFKDGDTTVAEVPFTLEDTTIAAPAVPVHKGYRGNWEDFAIDAKNLTISAVYTPILYTITYNSTKNAENPNPAGYTIETATFTLAPLSKAGYTFDGWYLDGQKITEITIGSTGDLTLVARWTAIVYDLTYMYNDAIGTYPDERRNPAGYTVEDEILLLPLENRTTGYTFLGWYTEKELGTGEKVEKISVGSLGARTLYAHWGLDIYRITYENTKGATNLNLLEYTVETETFALSALSKAGYTFDGWYLDGEKITEITIGSTGDLTLTAKWTAITYSITYITYGGTVTGGVNPTSYTVEDTFPLYGLTRAEAPFHGWYDSPTGGKKYERIEAGTTGNLVLYAPLGTKITFDTKGGSTVDAMFAIEGEEISAPAAPTRDHYIFSGWYTDAACTKEFTFDTMPAENFTLYAKWVPVRYTIRYHLDGGENAKGNPADYTVEDVIALLAPSKKGYTFIGWFTSAEYTTEFDGIPLGTHGEIDVYANFRINEYTISFDTKGGTSVDAIRQNYDTALTPPPAPAKNGYIFDGWYADEAYKTAYTFERMPAEDITLYAKWRIVDYTITYHLNNGTNAKENPTSYRITDALFTLLAPTRTGYRFDGFYADSEYTQKVETVAGGAYGDLELFAKWTPVVYTITYHLPSGAVHSNALTYTIETTIFELSSARMTGYTFLGWSTDAAGAERVYTLAGGAYGNIDLYGNFKANSYDLWLDGTEEASYEVRFDTMGGGGNVPTQTVDESRRLTYPATPSKAGYLFGGWYENADGTGRSYDFTAQITKNLTLYAKWVAVPENATALTVGETKVLTLKGTNELIFRFIPTVSGNITLTTTGNYDTFGALYNEDGVLLTQNDDGGSGDNFLILYNVTAWKCYELRVRSFSAATTGTATLSITGKNADTAGGFVITPSKTKVTFGDAFTLTPPAAREGYKFLGYADLSGKLLTDKEGKGLSAWSIAESTVLYSKWERTVYTVTFVTGSGTKVDPVTLAYGERLDLNEYLTSRDGYTFGGWYLDGELYEASTMPDHNITLNAKWISFSLGTIKYDDTKKAVRFADFVNGTLPASLFGALCLDTDGNEATFTVSISGTVAVGETVIVRLVAKSGNKTKQVTIEGVKIYGAPTLTYDESVGYFNLGKLTADHFSAKGTDAFGAASTIRFRVERDYGAGDVVTLIIESVDPAGNITSASLSDIRVYGAPTIRYLEEKDAIRVSDTIGATLFDASAVDSFGETLTVRVTKKSGTQSAGNTVILTFTATDSKGNTTTFDVKVKVYGTPTVGAATRGDARLVDTVTPEFLGIVAKDTYGKVLKVTLTVKSGTVSAGGTVVYTATATDTAGNTASRDVSVKFYGTPTITYRDVVKDTEDPTKDASALNAVAKDSFGGTLTLTITLKSGNFKSGESVVYLLSATDRLGNVATVETGEVRVYGATDIRFIYNAYDSDKIKLVSRGEEFSASATDTFGESCTITVEAASGSLTAGKTQDIYLVATDKAGNRVKSEKISGIRVYGTPTIEQIGYTLCVGDDPSFLFVARDSFGEEISFTATAQSTLAVNTFVDILVVATDDAGNETRATYRYLVSGDGFTYQCKASDKSVVLTVYTGTASVVTIVDGVTEIAAEAFKNNTALRNITVSDSVKKIGLGAFSGCSSLESMTLPFVGGSRKSASDTYQYPFGYIFGTSSYTGGVATRQYYYELSTSSTTGTTYYIPESLKSVTITGGNILYGAFSYCTGLTSITIPNSVTSIGNEAFYDCKGLKSFTIPNSVTRIGDNAFSYCTGLMSILIPDSVTRIAGEAFVDCTGLTGVYITDLAKWCAIDFDSFLYSSNPLI